MCSELRYTGNGIATDATIVEGDLDLAPGEEVVVTGFALNDTAADLGLYGNAGAFSDPEALRDYMQYGSSENARENVAVQKGIWDAGTFVEGNAPYAYIGDGTQNGVNWWEGTQVVTAANVRILQVDPVEDMITLKNFGEGTIDISNWRLCSKFQYTSDLTSTISVISGDLELAKGDTVVISGFALDESGADLGVYRAEGAFSDTAAMKDFMQWGNAGNGRESVAVVKGIWDAGSFIPGERPYVYQGNGSQSGVNFWNITTNFESNILERFSLALYPNPVKNDAQIRIYSPVLTELQLDIMDLQGRVLQQEVFSSRKGEYILPIDVKGIPSGIYSVVLKTEDQIISIYKFIKQ